MTCNVWRVCLIRFLNSTVNGTLKSFIFVFSFGLSPRTAQSADYQFDAIQWCYFQFVRIPDVPVSETQRPLPVSRLGGLVGLDVQEARHWPKTPDVSCIRWYRPPAWSLESGAKEDERYHSQPLDYPPPVWLKPSVPLEAASTRYLFLTSVKKRIEATNCQLKGSWPKLLQLFDCSLNRLPREEPRGSATNVKTDSTQSVWKVVVGGDERSYPCSYDEHREDRLVLDEVATDHQWAIQVRAPFWLHTDPLISLEPSHVWRRNLMDMICVAKFSHKSQYIYMYRIYIYVYIYIRIEYI